MTTSEFRSDDAEGELPVSADELAVLASQLYASVTGQVDQRAPTVPVEEPAGVSAPVAPRGTVPSSTAATSVGQTAGGALSHYSPLGATEALALSVPPLGLDIPSPGLPADSPAGTVPISPRGSSPGFATPDVDILGLGAPGLGLPGLGVPDLGVPDLSAFHSRWDTTGLERPIPSGADPQFYFLTGPRGSGQDALGGTHEVFDVASIRRDFPILRERVNGKPLIWFDNAATTQKPQSVIDRLSYFYAHENSNIHRGAHELARRATDAYEDAREEVRRFLGAGKPEEIIFVRGTTEAINLVAQSWGRKHLGVGDEIVITHLEHHANIVPWQLIAQQTGAIIKVAPVDDSGNLLLAEFEDLVGPRTKLVSAAHVSNALGTITPVEKIVEIGHRYGARVLIDGAQSVPHLKVDLQEIGADFFVFSGHKIFGPTGIGVLYGKEDVLAETPPWQGGGNMIADVTLERSIYQGPPNKFEAGTGNIADAVGLGEALRYVEKVGIERIAQHEHALLDYATPLLGGIDGVRLIGTAENKASVLSFVLEGHDPVEVGKALNAEGIAVRAGHHCAQPILRRLGVEQTVRPSFSAYNTFEEIDVFIRTVRRIAEGTLAVG